MSVRYITPGFAYINVLLERDGAGTVFLFFQRVAADETKYLSIHTQLPDGTPSKTPLLENREMYEPRGVLLQPDGTAVVYGANRNRSKVLKVDVPGWTPLVTTARLLALVTLLEARIVALEGQT